MKKIKIKSNLKQLLLNNCKDLFSKLENLDEEKRIDFINQIKLELHKYSPFKNEPIDCVQWIKSDEVKANDYNPNVVAPPEMELLRHSIQEDGYTQPIVSWLNNGGHEIVDGFHRNRVGKECKEVNKRVKGYLPVTTLKQGRQKRNNRIAATIRHNRARGKHTVSGMSDIVVELKRRNWSDEKICKNLGMDRDEVLRLCQISGLADLFSDEEFSKSWDIENFEEDNSNLISDDIKTYGDEVENFRTINTDDPDRIFHHHDKWECYKAGLYKTTMNGMTKDECEKAYCDFLSDSKKFSKVLQSIIVEWKYSCEHYLTNKSMNRIDWLGQAASCYSLGIPAVFSRGGFNLLSNEKQEQANKVALKYLNKWLKINKRTKVIMEEAIPNLQMDIY